MTGTKFKNISTGEIYTVIKFDNTAKQAIVELPDGKTKAYSATTLKDRRRFIQMASEEPEPVENKTKKSQPKAKKASTPATGVGVEIKDFIIERAKALDAEICESQSGKFISFKIEGKMFAAIFSWSKKGATLGTRSAAIEGTGYDCPKKMKHMMDCRFSFTELSNDNKKMIDKLLEASKKYQLNKKHKKEDK